MVPTEAQWLELALVVDGELAEAVAEVLSRYAPGGVAVESTGIRDEAEGEGVPEGPLRVTAYLPVDDRLGEVRRRIEEALGHLSAIRPLPPLRTRWIREADWVAQWKAHYHPVTVGSRLVIVPAWMDNPIPQRVPLFLDPGMAFGTGMHPTTQMCLAEVERLVRPGMTVLDIGCGSGILSIAALKLGAAQAVGVDTDPEAVRAAQANAQRNGVGERFVAFPGSVAEVLAGKGPVTQAPLVLANILAGVLVRLLREERLAETITPGGHVVLSGILDGQEADVQRAARAVGLTLARRRQVEDWVTLTYRRPDNPLAA